MNDIKLNRLGFITLGSAKLSGLCGLLCMFMRLRMYGAGLLVIAFILLIATVIIAYQALKLQRGEWKDDS